MGHPAVAQKYRECPRLTTDCVWYVQHTTSSGLSRRVPTTILLTMKRRGSNQAGQTAPHQVYAWSGSPYEIGFQHGQTLRNEIITEARAAVEAFVKGRRCTERKALQFALREWQPLFERHTPRDR